jgi:beta-lactam-binding protein with PASTA domain
VNGSVTHTATATLVVTSLPPTRPFGVDQFVFSDGSGTRTTPPFTTSAAGELVLAFAASGGPLPGTQSLTVSGAGLTWSLVARANAQGGTAEIWQAVAPTVLSNATVTSVQSLGGGYHQSLTVVTVSGAAGTGAAVSANGPTGAPLVTLTTTRPGSLVYGVGNDWDRAVARTLGPNQTLLHQVVDTATADTFWSQYLTAAVSTGGAAVQLNDTAPTSDKWNFTAVEILASGSPLATVPNVVGMTQTAAAMNIANAGLTLGTVTNQPSATVPAGSVISQSPAAGATASPQSAVNLTVSSGPPPPTSVQVPSVVGLTQAAATTVITSANLTVGTIGSSASPSVPAGSVISQNPAPGTAVAPGSAVNLVVSTGPPPVTVPNVVGMTQTAATAAIVGAGLKAGTVTNASSTSIPAGSVISQDPAAGASVALGSAVALVVSSGPAAGLTVASIVFSDGSGTRTTTPFSTAAAGEILLAFVASDGPASGTQSVTVTGAGLSWTLVNRANQRSGTAEIWQATADTQLSGVTVSSTQSAAGYHQSLTVIAFTGAGAIGASAAASGPTGGPAVSVTTTKAGSLVYGVGNDWDHAIARTVGANQQIVHQWVDTSTDDTYWVQATSSVIPGSGTAVLLDVTAPTTDQWNMVAVEILAQ